MKKKAKKSVKTDTQVLKEIERIFIGPKNRKRNGISISYDVYYNMMGAMIDIEETGKCDKVSLNTIKTTFKKIGKIKRVLTDWKTSQA